MASQMRDRYQEAGIESSSFRSLAISTPQDPQKLSQTLATIHQTANFSSLPSEIRRQIWLLTLAPRLIYLHPRQLFSSPTRGDQQNDPPTTTSIYYKHSLYSPNCTPASHFRAYTALFDAPDTPQSSRQSSDSNPEAAEPSHATEAIQHKPPRPPAALHVCKESRHLALQTGYVLAFKAPNLPTSTQTNLSDSHNSSNGIYTDFSRDVIMLTTLHPHIAPQDTLHLLALHFPYDIARIKRLALGGILTSITLAWRGHCVRVPGRKKKVWGWHVGMGFRCLEEMWLDDGFEGEGVRGDEERALRHVVMAVEGEAGKLGYAVEGRVPRVRFVRGEEWRGAFGG